MNVITWELSRAAGKIGTGNWQAFPKERLPELFDAVAEWKAGLQGIDRPWLCWCRPGARPARFGWWPCQAFLAARPPRQTLPDV